MTYGQKQLLRAVPVAVLLCGGLLALQYRPMREVLDRRAEEAGSQPVTGQGTPQMDRVLGKYRVSVDLHTLTAIERRLEGGEEFVRSVEALHPKLQGHPDAELRKKQDEQVEKAIAALNESQSLLKGMRVEELPPGDRARWNAATTKRTALLERLAKCRQSGEADTGEGK